MCDIRIVDLTRRCKPLVFAFYIRLYRLYKSPDIIIYCTCICRPTVPPVSPDLRCWNDVSALPRLSSKLAVKRLSMCLLLFRCCSLCTKTRRSVHWQPLRWRERTDYVKGRCVQWQRKSNFSLWKPDNGSRLYSQSRCLRLVCDRYEAYCNNSNTSVCKAGSYYRVVHSYLGYYIFSIKKIKAH